MLSKFTRLGFVICLCRKIVIACLFICDVLLADNWQFEKELSVQEIEFGDLIIHKVSDTRENTTWPELTIEIYKGENRLAIYEDMGFDHYFISDDQSILIGLSNSALTKSAYLIIDDQATLIKNQNHSSSIDYCEASVTLVRKWFNPEQLDIQFKFEGEGKEKRLKQISMLDCHGSRINIL